jgi:hypothetical protein
VFRGGKIRFLVATSLAVVSAAAVNCVGVRTDIVGRIFLLSLVAVSVFGIWIGLPLYSYLRSRNRASALNVTFSIACVYGVVYFLLTLFHLSDVTFESWSGQVTIRNGLLTLHGIVLLLGATLEVIAVGSLSNFLFWLIYVRPSRDVGRPLPR